MRRAKLISTALLGLLLVPLRTACINCLAFANQSSAEDVSSAQQRSVESPALFPSAPDAPDSNSNTQPHFVLARPKSVPPFPIVLNRFVRQYVHDMLERPGGLEASFERSRPFFLEMTQAFREKGVPHELLYLSFAESDFSKRGKGPWQFSKGTAQRYGLRINHWVDERRDPILSTKAAAKYLSHLHDEAGFDWRVAVVGWNGGDLAIDRFWLLRGQNFNRFIDLLPGHTRVLMSRFMAVAFIARNSATYGIGGFDYDSEPSYHEVPVKGGTRLSQVAGSFHTTVAKLHDLNPAILHDRVPPYAHTYKVRVPMLRTALAQ
jgi:hypothetical protein